MFVRAYLKINAYLSEGIVWHVPSSSSRGSKERRETLQIQAGMTVSQSWKSYRYQVSLR